MVDWSKPIEAVNTKTGEVVPVTFVGKDEWGDYKIQPLLDGGARFFTADGDHFRGTKPWRIRNRATLTLEEIEAAREAYMAGSETNGALFYAKRWGLYREPATISVSDPDVAEKLRAWVAEQGISATVEG